ncbi:NAD(P)H-dependent oxidoreductase [Poritiphilus flavus]|uniref:NAD(P)H-dependent oxidoreductase n=1 Tax=Poritiphilus flavus TaxID=2697053 RepID=A0A6L9EE57_9FLAO|nr:NAD(P)H-dependent oxidoreductase [Poritiphilus flavus]NAS13044.1 NAD(P)H-dependent oxidoreductase [Poritiphilus flavus]
MGNIIADLEWRYAVKKFDAGRMLPQEKIDKLKQAFNLTATSYGLQPIKLIVVSDKQIQEKLVSYSFDQKQVAQASHVLILCIETNVDDDYILSYFRRVQQVRGTSDEILDPFKQAMVQNFRAKKTQEIKEWAAKQAYLAMGNLLTICAVERIDSCPMEGFLPSEYDQVLKLEQLGLNSVLVLPVGYRAEDDMFQDFKKVRRSMDKSVIDIKGDQ